MQDLHSHREEDDNQEEWTALVFSVVAATLVQLPRAFVSMPRKKVKALVDRCYGLGREYLNRDFEEVTVTRCKCIPIPSRADRGDYRYHVVPVRVTQRELRSWY